MRCDLVVIGAGPAGLWTAKTAAAQGLDVIVLEEHHSVGLPKHCSGWLLGCEFTNNMFSEFKGCLPYQKVYRWKVIDPFSKEVREVIEDTGWGGYLVRRELFDRELARLALMSGARLFLNVKVSELLREDGRVAGVKTSSQRVPEVRAKVTICAGGAKSTVRFAQGEIASESEAEIYPGVQMELVNVREISPGEIEMYESEDREISGRSLWPYGQGVTLASFPSANSFFELKARQDNLFSKKLAISYPIYMGGFVNRKKMGYFFQRLVKGGVIFIGDACGCSGIIHGMITGLYAAKAAKEAVEDNEMQRVYQYEKEIKGSDIYDNPFCYRDIKGFYGSYRNWLERSKEIKV